MSERKPFYSHVRDEEARELSAPKIAELKQYVVREEMKTTTQEREQKGEDEPTVTRANQVRTSEHFTDELAYLQSILDDPFLGVVGRTKRLGFTNDKARKVRDKLLDKGMVEVLNINLGEAVGGTVKLLQLTEKGCKTLGEEDQFSRLKNVSEEHWFWQKQLIGHFTKLGHNAEIEMCVKGKNADVGYHNGKNLVAVEVAMTASNEVRNAKEDLAVGFAKVITACKNSSVMQAVEDDFRSYLTKNELEKISVRLLTSFDFVDDIIAMTRGRKAKR